LRATERSGTALSKTGLSGSAQRKEMARNSPSGGEKCFRTGLWGSIIAVICCFTPTLVIGLGFLGLAAVTPYLDYILFPLLAIFLILALYGWWRRKEHG